MVRHLIEADRCGSAEPKGQLTHHADANPLRIQAQVLPIPSMIRFRLNPSEIRKTHA